MLPATTYAATPETSAAVLAEVNWTDWVGAIAAIIAAVGVVGTLAWTAWELRRQSTESREQNRIRLAQRALDLLTLNIELNRLAVEHEELAAYLTGAEMPKPADPRYPRALVYGSLFTDFAETVGWHIRAGQMTDDAAIAWQAYFKELVRRTPIVVEAFAQYRELYARETRWLFGEPEMTPSLRQLGLDREDANSEG